MVDFEKIEVQQKKTIPVISTKKFFKRRNSPINANNSYMAKPAKSNRSFKLGVESKKSEENLLYLNSLANLEKPRVRKDKGSRAGSQNDSFKAKPSLLH